MGNTAGDRRIGLLADALAQREVQWLIVSAPANVRYLAGYSGSNGLLVLAATGTQARHLFLTDFRYETQAEQEVGGHAPSCERLIVTGELVQAAGKLLAGEDPEALREGAAADEGAGAANEGAGAANEGAGAGGKAAGTAGAGAAGPGGTATHGGSAERRRAGAAKRRRGSLERVGFDEHDLSVARHDWLADALGECFELVGCGGMVERLREVKEPEEQRRIAAAAELADRALVHVLEGGLTGRSERQVAIELERTMQQMGAQAASFPTIVASGAHAALPHAQPRAAQIEAGTLVTIDWGCVLDGYCSDCTRTFAAGPVGERAKEIYELVLAAQQAGLDALAPGRSGKEVDALAREVIERAGLGERFGHGLGHGVGVEIHEGPRLSRTASDDPLRAGTVVTVEPGVYLPGELGVRIEDLVVVEAQGPRSVSSLPKQLTVLS